MENDYTIKNNRLTFPINHGQILSSSSESLVQVLEQQLKGNSVVKYVGSTPLACLNCPFLQNAPNCNQCSQWNQQKL